MQSTKEFGTMVARLKAEKIVFSIEDTGGGCWVMFVRHGNNEEITITQSDEPSTDPANHWMVCHDVTRDHFWAGDSTMLDECASTDRVVELIREWQSGLQIIEIIAGPESV